MNKIKKAVQIYLILSAFCYLYCNQTIKDMQSNEEIWKDIPGYEGHYQASDQGRIKSLNRVTIRSNNTPLSTKERILKSWLLNGYEKIRLNKKGVTNNSVHRIIALTFLGPSNLDVDHIDKNRSNNNLSNLRYCTTRENVTYQYIDKIQSSKCTGVSRSNKKWRASIGINRKTIYLGVFDTEEDASNAYQNALSTL